MSRLIKYKTKLTDNKRAVLEKEISINCAGDTLVISCPQDVVRIAKDYVRAHEHTEEHMYMLCLNSKNRVIGVFEISHGNVNSSLVGSREIFQKALLANAVQIILVHNHPSGDTTPSKEDIFVTQKFKELGEFIGVPLVDHIIVGDDYSSIKALGYVE